MKRPYQKPSVVLNDMGGIDDKPDERLSMILELLGFAQLDCIDTVLDIGIGKGQLAKWFSEKGKKVTGTGLELESYGLNPNTFFDQYGISIIDCPIEDMPFDDKSFDAVVMSHILEHVPNVGMALQEVKRVLSDDGYLFIFVPPYEDIVCAGHISTGWNIGQLLYVLLVNGFNVKQGQFIEYGYNVCAFVQKSHQELPPLRGDRGDIYLLNQANLLPLSIVSEKDFPDNFYGRIKSLNWPHSESLLVKTSLSYQYRLLYIASFFIPRILKKKMGSMLTVLGKILWEQSGRTGDINPQHLRG